MIKFALPACNPLPAPKVREGFHFIHFITIVFASSFLAACGTTPSRQVGTQSAAPITDTKILPVESTKKPTPRPGNGGYLVGDGPGDDIPANIDSIPNAVPKAEPLHPYANRQYEALGQLYTPLTKPGNYKERGIASWYGKKFHGQHTSSGDTYDMFGMTAAHPTLPIPSYARVTNLANNKSVVVRINDRGPFLHDRIMDLSYTAAHKLGIIGNGSNEVEVVSIPTDSSAFTPIPTHLAVNDPVHSEHLTPASVSTHSSTSVGNTYLQLGAFKSQQGAESFLEKMRSQFEGSGKQIVLFHKNDLVRVHLGPYISQEEALSMAEKLQSRLGFKPIISLH